MNLKIDRVAQAAHLKTLDPDLDAINRYTLRPLTAEEVFVFRFVACDDQVDRDCERFPVESLEKLAPMFVGKSMIMDHRWSASMQQARIYAAEVVEVGEAHQLMLSAYMPRTEATEQTIAAIESGILKEVSVGCSMRRAVCTVCGKDYGSCGHYKGETYGGVLCVAELRDPADAYEVSFVAVPAQPGAGVIKENTQSGFTMAQVDSAKCELAIEHERWK